jgi:hypothetical protein
MSFLINFISNNFLNGLVVAVFGIISKVALKYFSNDRWEIIKENILVAMLWAEETYGLGHGQEKWQKAWQKIIELLEKKGIKLKEKEISLVTDMMKSNVPVINSITYSTVPEVTRELREAPKRHPEIQTIIEKLRKKRAKADK